jgi:hypothetical protein
MKEMRLHISDRKALLYANVKVNSNFSRSPHMHAGAGVEMSKAAERPVEPCLPRTGSCFTQLVATWLTPDPELCVAPFGRT